MMKRFLRHIAIASVVMASLLALAEDASAQTDTSKSSSSSAITRKRGSDKDNTGADGRATAVTDRMQQRFDSTPDVGDADKEWMRVIYRQLDLDRAANAPLYYPVDIIDGEENLFRIIMRLLMADQIKAYEYLDGREIFTDKYRLAVRDLLDKCYIAYSEAKGSTEKSPRFVADEADIPAAEVLRYYVIEQWEFDRRNNRLHNNILAICPVLMRVGEYSSEPEPMPLFWIRYSDLRPHLAQQTIFLNDDNNLPTCTYDDFFNLTMYEGDIYKTRNLKNKSMAQLYPDPEDRKRAQDSIQARLDKFEERLWTPTREELLAQAEAKAAAEAAAPGDSTEVKAEEKKPAKSARATRSNDKARSKKKPAKVKESSASKSSSATKSVRRRKK